MLTLFTCPKAFTDPHIRQIQRNAIQSWMRLDPRPEILLAGDDEGVKETAVEFGLRHVSSVERNARGTPLVCSVFEKAQAAATHALLAYVNTDIVLGPDFTAAVSRCQGLKAFLLIGRRWDMDVPGALDFRDPAWHDKLRRDLHDRGKQHGPAGLDYFVFRKGLWSDVPPFALGRCAWDNWLVYRAAAGGASLVDGSQAVTAVHQNHDYAHSGHASAEELWRSEEAGRNRILAGGVTFDVLDCGYRLKGGRLHVARDRDAVLRRMERFHEYRPLLWNLLLSWKIRSFL